MQPLGQGSKVQRASNWVRSCRDLQGAAPPRIDLAFAPLCCREQMRRFPSDPSLYNAVARSKSLNPSRYNCWSVRRATATECSGNNLQGATDYVLEVPTTEASDSHLH